MSPHAFRNGAIVLAVLVFALVAGFSHHIPFTGGEGGQLVRAEVTTADGVNSSTPVRVQGVGVGHVVSVERGASGRTSVIVMRITNSQVSAHRDARAFVRWRTILGGSRYIDLNPGSPSAAGLGKAVIPLSRTSAQVDWDQFNQPYTARTRQNERGMIKGFRDTLADPAGEGRTLHTLGPALSVVGRGTEAMRGREAGDLTRLVQNTAKTFNGLSEDAPALQGLVDGAARTLAVTARERTALGQTIELSPPALAATTQTMRRLMPTLARLDPLVAALRPGARALDPALADFQPTLQNARHVLRDARPLLRTAPAAFTALEQMSRQGGPVVDGLKPTVLRLNRDLIPFLGRRDDDTKLRNYEAIGPMVSVLDSAAGEFDASGHFLHFMTGGAADSVLLPCDEGLSPSPKMRCDLVNEVLKTVLGGGKAK